MKAVKWIVGIVLGVIVLAVAGVAALVVLVDPNDYKPQIAAKVQETTGRTLDISGNIGWTFFPWLGMEAGAMTLGNAPGFEGKPFAGIERAQVRVALTPLFKGQVQVGTVILQGLVLNLARDKEGRTNWADLAARESQPAPPTTEESQPSAKALPALAVEGVRIENASLSWQDMVEGQEVVVDKLNLSLASLTLGKPFTVLFSGQVRTAKPETVTTIEISAKPTVQTDLKTVTIQDFVLKTDSRGQVFPAGRTEVTVRMEADLGQDQAKISGFELSTYGITVLAEVLAKMAGQKPDVDIKLQVPEFSPKALMAALGLPAPVTADPQALTRASTTFSATMRNGTLALTQNQRLDDTKIDLEAQILNFEGPAARFDLVVDAIDVDRYLPPASEKKTEAKAEPEGKPVAQEPSVGVPLPLEDLRKLDLEGRFRVGKVKVKNVHSQDIDGTVKAKKGVLSLDPMTAKAYEGTVEAKASLDVRQDLPAYTVSKSVTGFQVGPYLKDFIGKDPIEGTASMKADFAGRGLTEEEILKNLAGVFSFRFENGAVNGINVPKMLRDAVGLFRGQRPVPDEDLKTDFALLSGSVHVADALAVNKDLKMEAPLLRVSGAGRVNLLTKAVDYGTQVAVVATLKGQEGEPLSELAGLTVPLKITGTYDKPEFGLDVASVLKDKAVQEGLDRLKKEVEISKDVEEKIPEEVKEKLPGVLDRFIKK